MRHYARMSSSSTVSPAKKRGGPLLRILALSAFAALAFAFGSLGPSEVSLRPDTSRAALTTLGQEYDDLRLWTAAIAAAADTLPAEGSEGARALADQLARLMGPLEDDFERTTSSLSTAQLELVLPLWERMAFAHAGFAMLQEQAAALGGDPLLQPAELQDLVSQLSAVLEFAAEIQRLILDELTAPIATPIRLT
jgi:hypothetical protein